LGEAVIGDAEDGNVCARGRSTRSDRTVTGLRG
jgi:hypothetical protein